MRAAALDALIWHRRDALDLPSGVSEHIVNGGVRIITEPHSGCGNWAHNSCNQWKYVHAPRSEQRAPNQFRFKQHPRADEHGASDQPRRVQILLLTPLRRRSTRWIRISGDLPSAGIEKLQEAPPSPKLAPNVRSDRGITDSLDHRP